MDLDREIQKIKGYKTWDVKRKVDTLLRIDAEAYTNLGRDSKTAEKKRVRSNSRKIYTAIAEISPIDGYLLEAHMREKDMTIKLDS